MHNGNIDPSVLEEWIDPGAIADEHDVDAGSSRFNSSGHDDLGSVIPSHGVDGNT